MRRKSSARGCNPFSETDAPYRFINAGVVATMAAETRVRVERHDDGCAFIWSQHHVDGVRRIAWFAPNDTSKPVTTRTMLSLIGVSDPALHAWRIRAYERAKHDRHYAELPDVADEMPARFTLADYPEVVRGRSVRYGCGRDTCTGGPSFRVNGRRFDTLWIDGIRYRYEGIPAGRAAVHAPRQRRSFFAQTVVSGATSSRVPVTSSASRRPRRNACAHSRSTMGQPGCCSSTSAP